MPNQFYQASAVEAIMVNTKDIARLQSEVAHLQKSVDGLTSGNLTLSKQVEEIRQILAETKGGWRMLMLIGGASATFGSTVTWWLQHLNFK